MFIDLALAQAISDASTKLKQAIAVLPNLANLSTPQLAGFVSLKEVYTYKIKEREVQGIG